MITLHELLKDPDYREFFCSVPVLPATYTPERQPWRLMVRKKGDMKWRMKRYGTYQEAFKALKRVLPRVSDAAINCPSLDFTPPYKTVKIRGQYMTIGKGRNARQIQRTKRVVWTPKLPLGEEEDHYWCPFCRRPSAFRRVNQHPMLPRKRTAGVGITPDLFRCVICGASENIVNLKKPLSHQRWASSKMGK